MFEYKLQRAWDRYLEDFGLGRISLFISLICVFFFLFSLIFYSEVRFGFLLPVVIVYVLTFFNSKISSLSDLKKFSIVLSFLAFIIPYLYYETGVLDESGLGLVRYDYIFATIDQQIFGDAIANIIQKKIGTGLHATIFYDWIQLSYLFYFFFPFYGAIVYYRALRPGEKYKSARLICSVAIFFTLNYFLYIVVPVTGPQYFMPSDFTVDLPFSFFGEFINYSVRNGQPTFIDCFPSGHVGISLLMTIWFFRIKSKHRFFSLFMLISIFLATLALRYHYTLDVICSVPLVIFCYKISRIIIPVTVYRRNK